MKPCPPPDGLLLPAHHFSFFENLLNTLADKKYSAREIFPLAPQIANDLSQLCTDDELRAWCDEVALWVRWHRVEGYWLSYIFHLAAKARNSILLYFCGCDLYSDAQSHFADDHGLSTLETAYVGYVRNRDRLDQSFTLVGNSFREKLRYYYDYYYQWSQHLAYNCNPCSDHMYSAISQYWLTRTFHLAHA